MIKIEYRVPYADTDQMGVVYYANYFVFFERARNELLRAIGYSYLELEKSGNIAMPVIEANCRYKSSAHYDDLLTITAKVAEAKGVKVKICCDVMRGDELLVSGYTVHACVDMKTKKIVRVPDFMLKMAEA